MRLNAGLLIHSKRVSAHQLHRVQRELVHHTQRGRPALVTLQTAGPRATDQSEHLPAHLFLRGLHLPSAAASVRETGGDRHQCADHAHRYSGLSGHDRLEEQAGSLQ